MEWWLIGVICFTSLIALLVIGVPVAFSLSFVSMIVMYFMWGFDGLMTVATSAYSTNANFLLIAIPLFIFMGECIAISGIGNDAFRMIDIWLGWLPGGVAITTVGCCTIFGAVTGFAPATCSALGPGIIPELIRRKYDKGLGLGALAGGAGLAIIIPPSILMIIYGALAEISVGRLFYAGVLPGVIIALIFCLYIIIKASLHPELAPKPEIEIDQGFIQKIAKSVYILPLLGLIVLVLGTIWGGIASPSEAAALGAFGSLCLLVYYKKFTIETIKKVLIATVQVNCMVMFILIGGTLFTQIMSGTGFAPTLASWVTSLPVSRWIILFLMQFFIILAGCLMDPASILFIFTPIYLPIVNGLGFDLYWFGILTMINCGIATITPPVGIVLYVLKGVSPEEITLKDIISGSSPYWLLYIIGMIPVIFFSGLVTWLPDLIIGR